MVASLSSPKGTDSLTIDGRGGETDMEDVDDDDDAGEDEDTRGG